MLHASSLSPCQPLHASQVQVSTLQKSKEGSSSSPGFSSSDLPLFSLPGVSLIYLESPACFPSQPLLSSILVSGPCVIWLLTMFFGKGNAFIDPIDTCPVHHAYYLNRAGGNRSCRELCRGGQPGPVVGRLLRRPRGLCSRHYLSGAAVGTGPAGRVHRWS